MDKKSRSDNAKGVCIFCYDSTTHELLAKYSRIYEAAEYAEVSNEQMARHTINGKVYQVNGCIYTRVKR